VCVCGKTRRKTFFSRRIRACEAYTDTCARRFLFRIYTSHPHKRTPSSSAAACTSRYGRVFHCTRLYIYAHVLYSPLFRPLFVFITGYVYIHTYICIYDDGNEPRNKFDSRVVSENGLKNFHIPYVPATRRGGRWPWRCGENIARRLA